MCIFVLAWCWVFATIFKPRNVKCNIFSELTLNASLLFFRKKINEKCSRKILRDKWNLNRTLSKNFVLKIHCGKPNFARQIKFAWQWKSENQTLWINVVLSFKFRKYKTAFNNGLKIWLLPDFPAENPLLNGMFCYFCNGLVLHLRHIFKPQNVVWNHWATRNAIRTNKKKKIKKINNEYGGNKKNFLDLQNKKILKTFRSYELRAFFLIIPKKK